MLQNALFSTVVFVLIYFFYILPRPHDILQFGLIFVSNIVAGLFGSIFARIMTGYYDDITKTSQFYSKTMIAALLNTMILFYGLFGYIMDRYVDFTTVTVAEFLVYMVSREFIEIIAMIMVIKVIVYLLSDFLADKTAFGG